MMKKILCIIIMLVAFCATGFAAEDTQYKLKKYYPISGTPYKIAVEKYEDGMIRFKAKQMQGTYLYLAVPQTQEYVLKKKDRGMGEGGWIEIQHDVYQKTSFIDKMVKTAIAIAYKSGVNITKEDVGADSWDPDILDD